MNKITKKEYKRRMGFARQEAARVWCGKTTSGKVMDTNLAEEFAKILVAHMYAPHLGCARTSELQEEINCRNGRESATIDAGNQ